MHIIILNHIICCLKGMIVITLVAYCTATTRTNRKNTNMRPTFTILLIMLHDKRQKKIALLYQCSLLFSHERVVNHLLEATQCPVLLASVLALNVHLNRSTITNCSKHHNIKEYLKGIEGKYNFIT